MASGRLQRDPNRSKTRRKPPLLTGLGLLAFVGLFPACSEAEHGVANDDITSSGPSSSTTNSDVTNDAGTSAGGGSSLGGTSSGGGSTTGPDSGPAYLKASNADPGDLFGVSAVLSNDGSLLAVGANREASSSTDGEDDNSVPDSGAAYLFVRDASGWQEQAYLKASNAGEGDAFGSVIAMSADGSTLAIGAPYEASNTTGVNGNEDDDSAPNAGAVFVFARNGDVWQQQAYLKGFNTDGEDHFGISVALSADGSTLVVGAEGEDSPATGVDGDPTDKSAYEAGAAYLFRRSDASWKQETYFKASNTEAWDHFGSSVALAADGNTLAVGAHSEDSASSGVDGDQSDNSATSAGAVYVFVHDETSWSQGAYLKPAQNDGYAYDSFGSVVSLSADGATLAVGAPGDASAATGVDGDPNNTTLPYAGAVYLFGLSGSSWVQQAYLKASNTGEADEFGHNIKLSDDGTTLAVGAALEASASSGVNGNQNDNSAPEAGAVYLFGTEEAAWQQLAFIKAPNTDAGDRFGWSVGLSADGSLLAIGADREASAASGVNGNQNDNSATQAGAVYVYDGVSTFPKP